VLYSDEAMLPTENNTGRGVIAYRWQTDPSNTDVTATWSAYYVAINRANRIIAAADKITGANATEEATRKRIKGEALALRAFGHLQLMANFSEGFTPDALAVPYVKISSTSINPARQKVSEVVALIKADIIEAQALIPASFTTRTRITLPATHAILARASLYGRNWDDAINAATAAINAVPLATRTQYPGIWTDASNNEVIWKLKRETGQERMGDAFYDRSQSKVLYAPSSELISTFDQVNDVRFASTVLYRGAGNTRPSIGKYFGGNSTIEGLADLKVFRTAEMYLIRAEAYAERSAADFVNAQADLNTLRAARINGYTPVVFATKQALIDAIMEERFKELAFEAHRLVDLRRKGLSVTRLPADAINALGAVTLNPADKVYYFPIPDQEIRSNPSIIQNAGYR
jgi:hypothetical protein